MAVFANPSPSGTGRKFLNLIVPAQWDFLGDIGAGVINNVLGMGDVWSFNIGAVAFQCFACTKTNIEVAKGGENVFAH